VASAAGAGAASVAAAVEVAAGAAASAGAAAGVGSAAGAAAAVVSAGAAAAAAALERSACTSDQGSLCFSRVGTYQEPGSPRPSSPQQPEPRWWREPQRPRLYRQFISSDVFDGGKGIASRRLTGRGLGGSRSSSGIGLGSLDGSGRGRSGSWSGGSRGLLGLLVLGGLLDRLVAALLEGSLELALQVVEGAERCREDESVSCSFSFLADRCATQAGGPAVTASGNLRDPRWPRIDSIDSIPPAITTPKETRSEIATYECQA
jgi:hypothetical protein